MFFFFGFAHPRMQMTPGQMLQNLLRLSPVCVSCVCVYVCVCWQVLVARGNDWSLLVATK